MSSNVEHPGDPIRAEGESTALERVQKPLNKVSERLSTPTGAAALAGGLAIGAALIFGPAPTALGLGAAYAAYRFMQKRGEGEKQPPPQDTEPPPIEST